MPERRPVCTILGGPNGSGKSSLYEALKPIGLFVNADREARHIPEPIIRRRYSRAILKLGQAILIADETVVLDNTGYRPNVVLRIRGRTIRENHLDLDEPVHARIWTVVTASMRR